MKAALPALVLVLAASAASGQMSERAVFVAHNGNLEGSVSVMTLDAQDRPVFRFKYVTGSRPNTQQFHPGTNAYGISLTPDGAFLCTSHTTSSTTVEQLTMLRVNSDATLSLAFIAQTPDSPLEIRFVRDDLLAVTRTRTSGTNEVIMYRFDRGAMTLTEIDRKGVGVFTAYLAVSPDGNYLFAPDSSGLTLYCFRVEPDGTLSLLSAAPTSPVYCLGPGLSPDGRFLYGGGGISNSGNKIVGFSLSAGVPTPIDPYPMISPGASPKQVIVERSGAFAFVAHGTDATFRSFSVNQSTGALTSLGFSFDVGLQGSLGTIETFDDLIFVTDNTTATDGLMGLYAFRIMPDGSFQQNGPIVDTTGIAPQKMALWRPATCRADFNGDGQVDFFDYLDFVDAFANEDPSADYNGDGQIDFFDYLDFIADFAAGCD